MECFVRRFELFRDKSRTDASYVIEFLMKHDRYTEAGAKIRVGYAGKIFAAGRDKDALRIIASAERIPNEVAWRAKILLNEGVSKWPTTTSE